MDLWFKLRKAAGSVRFRLCLQAGRYSMLAEVTRQEAPATGAGGNVDAPAIWSKPSCLDALTLRSGPAMLNCTEVIGQHRNGCTGYTKVCEPRRGGGRRIAQRSRGHGPSCRSTRFPGASVETPKKGHMGLQESKIVLMENKKTEIE
jgi:hypothetical protein